MTAFYFGACAVLLLTLVASLYRVAKGPSPADRMISAQLVGTTGLAIVLLIGQAMDQPAAVDIAFVFALLAALATVAFVRCELGPPQSGDSPR